MDELENETTEQESSTKANKSDNSGSKSAKAASGAAKVVGTVASNTPVGRIANFFSSNKQGVAIGGGIFATLVSAVILIMSLLPPGLIVAKGAILGEFAYGPLNRSVVRMAFNVKDSMGQNTRNTRMAEKKRTAAANPNQANRIATTEPRDASRMNRRVQHRSTITSRMDPIRRRYGIPRVTWKIFEGRPLNRPGAFSPRLRLMGITDQNRTSRSGTRFGNTMDEIRQADSGERRSIARRFARRSGITFTSAVTTFACLSAYYDEMLPDPEEEADLIYERHLTYGVELDTAASQLALGEDVHPDEVADANDLYFDDEEVNLDDEDIEAYEDVGDGEGETARQSSTVRASVDDERTAMERHSRSFADSAAHKRATNLPIAGFEEDIALIYGMEDIGSFSSLIAQGEVVSAGAAATGGVINTLTGGNATLACNALGVVAIPLFLAEAAVTIKSGGGIQVLGRLIGMGAMIGATAFLIEQLSFDQIGPEGPVMQTGNTALGQNLANSEFARAQGATHVTSSEMNDIRTVHFEALADEDRERGFVWRYLSPQNPRSNFTSIAITTSFTPKSVASYILNIPSNLVSTITSNIFPSVSAEEDFNNYNIEQWHPTENQINMPVVETDEYFEFIDGEEFDLGGSGYACTFSSTDILTWNGLPDDVRQANMELGNGEIMRSEFVVYYNFEGPVDPDNRAAGPTECNTQRWRDAVLMYEIIDQCMMPEYYKMRETRGWNYNALWTEEQSWMTDAQKESVPYVERNISNTDARFPQEDNPAWMRQFAWGTPFNARDELRPTTFGGFGSKSFTCNSVAFQEGIEFIDAWGRSTNAFEFWERLGAWRKHNPIVDNFVCLSTDDPC